MGAFSHHISSSRRPFSLFSFIYLFPGLFHFLCLSVLLSVPAHLSSFGYTFRDDPQLQSLPSDVAEGPGTLALPSQSEMHERARVLSKLSSYYKKKNAHDANQNIISTLLFFFNVSLVRLL